MHTRSLPMGWCVFALLACAARGADAASQWVTPGPPYPAAARMTREQGTIILRIATDATGRIAKVTAAVPGRQKDDLPNIAQTCVKWVLEYWHGPPNVTRRVEMEFVLR